MRNIKDDLHTVWEYYRELPFLSRLLVRWRASIAPFDWILSHIGPDDFILDIGCGHGLLSNWIKVQYPHTRILAVDKDANKIGLASKTVQGRLGLDFEVGEAWAQGKADVIIFFDILHHLPEGSQGELLLQAKEGLKPGGKILLKEMVKEWSIAHFLNWLHDKVVTLGKKTHYRRVEEWQSLAGALGLSVTHFQKGYKFCYHHFLFVLEP